MEQGVGVDLAVLEEGVHELQPGFEAAGVRVHHLGVISRGYRKFPRLVASVAKLCGRVSPDAVLCFAFGWHSYVAWGAWLAGVGRIVTHAGNHPVAEGHETAPWKLRLTVGLGRVLRPKVICCSEFVRQGVAEQLPVPAEDLTTIYNAVPMEQFSRAPLRGMKLRSPIRMGMVGRTDFTKDYQTLIAAMAELRRRGVVAELEIVGDGSGRGNLETLAQELGVGTAVRFLGSRRDVPELLGGWDLFVYSAKQFEGLGVALIEAAAAGVPVICSDVPGCREVLQPRHGEPLGETVRAGDAGAIADAVERFDSDREFWWLRADHARADVRQRFSIRRMVDSYLRLLESR
jgi:glycosyltransferase involved in cell wall biosynthesis